MPIAYKKKLEAGSAVNHEQVQGYVLKPRENVSSEVTFGHVFPATKYDPKGLFALLQYLIYEAPQTKIIGDIHAPDAQVDHTTEHAILVSSKEIATAKDLKEATAEGVFACLESIKVKATNPEYVYSSEDRQQFNLAKQIFSGVLEHCARKHAEVMVDDKDNENALSQVQIIKRVLDASRSVLAEFKPLPKEEVLNFTAIAYEAIYQIYYKSLGRDEEKRDELTKAVRQGGVGRKEIDNLKEVNKLLHELERDAAKQYLEVGGEKIPGSREVNVSQVGFTDGEGMGVNNFYSGIALVIRSTKDTAEGAKKGALALANLYAEYSNPEMISGIFAKFLERNPGLELKDLEVTLIGGKGSPQVHKFNVNGTGLVDFNLYHRDPAIEKFQNDAGYDTMTALRVLDFLTANKIPLKSTHMFKSELPSSFVVRESKDGLEVVAGRPEKTRAHPLAAQFFSAYNLNSQLGNVAFLSADAPYTPLSMTRRHFDDATRMMQTIIEYKGLNSVKTQDDGLDISRGSVQRLYILMAGHAFRDVFVSYIGPLYNRIISAAEGITSKLTGALSNRKVKEENKDALINHVVDNHGITFVLPDDNKAASNFNPLHRHFGIPDLEDISAARSAITQMSTQQRGFKPSADVVAMANCSAKKVEMFEIKPAKDPKTQKPIGIRARWTEVFLSALDNISVAAERKLAEMTVGDAFERMKFDMENKAPIMTTKLSTELRKVEH